MPYKSTMRPVIVQKLKPQPPPEAPKNVIIEYEKQNAIAIRQVIEEGVFRVDPLTYQTSYSGSENSEIRYVERITDLPIENSRILAELSNEPMNNLSSMYRKSSSSSSSAATTAATNNAERESYNDFFTQYFSSSSFAKCSGSKNDEINSSNVRTSFSTPHVHEEQVHKSAAQHTNQSSYLANNNYAFQSAEYETITTSVPESLAAKIIAEAQAAGAISRSSNNNNY